MTHTLHPEIEKAIKKARYSLGSDEELDIDMFESIISKHLGPYLSLPKDNETDNLHDLLGRAFTILTNNPQNEDDQDLFPHLEGWLESNSIETHGTGIRKEGLKQSTPQIEPHIQKLHNPPTDDEFQAVVIDKINELIGDNKRLWDYINNNLPTKL